MLGNNPWSLFSSTRHGNGNAVEDDAFRNLNNRDWKPGKRGVGDGLTKFFSNVQVFHYDYSWANRAAFVPAIRPKTAPRISPAPAG